MSTNEIVFSMSDICNVLCMHVLYRGQDFTWSVPYGFEKLSQAMFTM